MGEKKNMNKYMREYLENREARRKKLKPAPLKATLETLLDNFGSKAREMSFHKRSPLIYFLIKDNEIIYIGKTTNFNHRIGEHQKHKDFDRVFTVDVDLSYPWSLNNHELNMIYLFRPKLNGPQNIIPNELDFKEYNLKGVANGSEELEARA